MKPIRIFRMILLLLIYFLEYYVHFKHACLLLGHFDEISAVILWCRLVTLTRCCCSLTTILLFLFYSNSGGAVMIW
jgi:hypothetical protein